MGIEAWSRGHRGVEPGPHGEVRAWARSWSLMLGRAWVAARLAIYWPDGCGQPARVQDAQSGERRDVDAVALTEVEASSFGNAAT